MDSIATRVRSWCLLPRRSLAQRLASAGKRILLLERGDYLLRSPKNWDSQTVFVDGAYQANETWYGPAESSWISTGDHLPSYRADVRIGRDGSLSG